MLTDAQKAWQEKLKRLSPHKYYSEVSEAQVRELYLIKNTKEGWSRMTRDEQKQYLMENIKGCNDRAAELLVDCSIASFQFPLKYRAGSAQNAAMPRKGKSKIKSEEMDTVLVVIVERFGKNQFQNKDIAPFVKDLSARQIPSRLKKLVEDGKLEDLGGSPKSYRLKG